MIDVRIICAHDALERARDVTRLLAAEGHEVALCYGRASLAHLAASRARREALIVIWSERAPPAMYPLQWAHETDPARLVEIAFCEHWPPVDRRAGSVIDFTRWNGLRGGAAWHALQERLRAVTRATAPPKPQPRRAAMVLAGASLVAAAGALWARFEADRAPLNPQIAFSANLEEAPAYDGGAQGGALDFEEPETYAPAIRFRPMIARSALSDIAPMIQPVAPAQFTPPLDFEEPGLVERLLTRVSATPSSAP